MKTPVPRRRVTFCRQRSQIQMELICSQIKPWVPHLASLLLKGIYRLFLIDVIPGPLQCFLQDHTASHRIMDREQALEIADMLVRSGAVDLVVIDSVAALIPQTELEGAMGETQVGGHARLMSHALRKLTGTIHKSRTAVIFINQIRMKIGVTGYGSPETTTGGNALKFYSSVRLDIRKIQTLKDKEEAYGSLTRVKVVKNKMAPPFREAKFDIIWGTGISRSGELIDLGVDAGIVDKSGAWFAFGAEKLGQGKEKVRALLDETPELRNAIESQLIEHLGMNPRPVVHAPEETLPDPENAPVDDMDDEI